MILKKFASKLEKNRLRLLSPERKIPKLEMVILIGVYTNIAIWLKTCLHDLSIFELSPVENKSY